MLDIDPIDPLILDKILYFENLLSQELKTNGS